MHFVTHYFAHPETLCIARRWLIQLGFNPDHIEVSHEGTPRLALMVPDDRLEEAELLINAAELTDPDGWPGFWTLTEHAQMLAPRMQVDESLATHQAQTTAIGWRPADGRKRTTDNVPLTEIWDVSTWSG